MIECGHEVWEQVAIANGYEVSNKWRVRRISNGKIITSLGSVIMVLNNGKRQTVGMSILMARHFLDNPHGFKTTSFKNGKNECYLSNLQWGGKIQAANVRLVRYDEDAKYGV